MNSFRKLFGAAVAMTVISAGCSCEPIISAPDGGTGGGAAGGRAGGAAGGMAGGAAGGMAGGAAGGMAGGAAGGMAGGAAGGMAGGAAGGMAGGAAGGMAGGAAGGAAGGTAGGAAGGAATQFTQFARDLINTRTTASALPADAGEFQGLPDDAPITYPPSFFDGGL
jgi:hypothetical protein